MILRLLAHTLAAHMDDPLVLWLIGDGKPGHENQSLGLAEAIGRRVPVDIHRIRLAQGRGLLGRLAAATATAKTLPRPDFILGAGHATHLPLLWLARKYGAKSVVLMKPSLPLACFDWCIAPEHVFHTAARARMSSSPAGRSIACRRVTP